jgi:hypothetical protein
MLTAEQIDGMTREQLIERLATVELKQRDAENDRKEAKKAKKNDDFYMVFKRDNTLLRLAELSSIGCRLFFYIAKLADRQNALVASQKALAQGLKTTQSNISKGIKAMEEVGLISRHLSGKTSVLVLNQDVVWSGWANGKGSCWFNNAAVFLSKDEQTQPIQKRINALLATKPAPTDEEAEELAETV